MEGNRTILRAFFGRGEERSPGALAIKIRVSRNRRSITSPDFSKKNVKVVKLFLNCPAKLSDFLKKVWQRHRTFPKKFTRVAGLFKKSPGRD
jgi:hypothetical protein